MNKLGKEIFYLKYKLRLAKEGKDFFTCNAHGFCRTCNHDQVHGKFKMVPRPCERNSLKYVFSEDWFIYAIDSEKQLYYVNTEMWEEWLDITEEQMNEKHAIKKYMLPIARRRWHELCWRAVDIYGEPVKFSYLKHFWNKANLRYHLYYRWRNKVKKMLRKYGFSKI